MNEESNSANGLVAQLGERLNGIQEVKGSIPFRSTIRNDEGFRYFRRPFFHAKNPLFYEFCNKTPQTL